MRNIRLLFASLLAASLLAPPAWGLDLPRLANDWVTTAGPAIRSDALLIRLRAEPARRTRLRRVPALRPALLGDGASASVGIAALDAAARRLGGARFEPMFAGEVSRAGAGDLLGFYRVRLPAGADLDRALAEFAALSEVASAEPIGVVPVSLVPNDSLFPISTWYFQASRRDIHAPEAWSVWTGDTTVVIGIIDTGILYYHPDLGGSIAGLTGNLFTNWAERGGVAGVDDDGNGKVDDVSGWDFVAAAVGAPFPQGEDISVPDNDPVDFAGHGTMVAGLSGALTDNGIGVAGTAPVVRLMPLRIGWSTNAAPFGLVDMSYAAEAIVYGTQNGATVLNCSFETVANSALEAAVVAAGRAGVIVVFAAGNNGGPNEYARRGDVVTVAATDATDHIAGFSNLGSFVDVAAPGDDIKTTAVVRDNVNGEVLLRPTYSQLDGTSFSAPMVSGAIALYESRRRALGGPRLNSVNTALRLWDTADDIKALNPLVTGYGGGRLNLERLLLAPQVSRAFRAGARNVGPSIIVHERSGTRLAWVASNRALVIADAGSGETLGVATLPGALGRQIAAADLGGGRGVGIFGGTTNGRLVGYDLHAVTLPGWPFNAGGGLNQFTAGPALGDLDGDGVLEVVSGSVDGSVWAVDADGVVLPAFPLATSALGLAGAVALADVDGEAGDEIVAAARDGQLHVMRFDGGEPPGWPAAIPGAAPTVSPVAAVLSGTPALIVAGGTQAHAFDFSGGLLWSAALGGTVSQDPAPVDLDGDGSHELVFAISGPNAVTVLDGAGAPLTSWGWPAALSAAPAGPPVVGPVFAGEPKGVMLLAGSALVALGDSATATRFTKPGGAGANPSLDDTDGDGRTEVAAGTGPDSLYYLYDAGEASASGIPGPWPTPRGDIARRGNAIAPRPLPVVDLTPPDAIDDLSADSMLAGGVTLRWTAPGGDGADGRAARYEVNITPVAAQAAAFLAGTVRQDAAVPDPAGASQRYRFEGLAAGVTLFAAVRAVDSTGNIGAASNVRALRMPDGPFSRVRAGGLAPLAQPSIKAVRWAWQVEEATAAGPREIRLYDVTGRWLATLALGPGSSGITEWNGRDHAGRTVPAGMIFARLVSGSFHAQSRVVLLP